MRALPIALASLFVLAFSTPAVARNGGLYFEFAPGYGMMFTDEVIVDFDRPGGGLAQSSFSPGLKFGLNLFGWAGAEAQFAGHFWGLGAGGDPGGGGYVGGVFRLTPLEVFTYILPTDLEIPSVQGPKDWKNRPFDLGISIGGGYTIIGEDYAYQGSFFQWGLDFKYFITPQFALGIELPFRHLNYAPFRYTDLGDAQGFCTDGAKQVFGGVEVPVDPSNQSQGISDTYVAQCTGRPPAALFFAPALTITGVFDFGI
jgi:hypothetical protein